MHSHRPSSLLCNYSHRPHATSQPSLLPHTHISHYSNHPESRGMEYPILFCTGICKGMALPKISPHA